MRECGMLITIAAIRTDNATTAAFDMVSTTTIDASSRAVIGWNNQYKNLLE